MPSFIGPIGPGALRAPGPYWSSNSWQIFETFVKSSFRQANCARHVEHLEKTSRHSLEIASHQAKLRNIRLFEQPPTRNFETFVKKVRRPSKLSRRSPKVGFLRKIVRKQPRQGSRPDIGSKFSIQHAVVCYKGLALTKRQLSK